VYRGSSKLKNINAKYAKKQKTKNTKIKKLKTCNSATALLCQSQAWKGVGQVQY